MAVQFLMDLSMFTLLLLFKMSYSWVSYLYLSNFYVKLKYYCIYIRDE